MRLIHRVLERCLRLSERYICCFVTLLFFALVATLVRFTALLVCSAASRAASTSRHTPHGPFASPPLSAASFPGGSASIHRVTCCHQKACFLASTRPPFEAQFRGLSAALVKVLDGGLRCLLTTPGPVAHMAHKLGHSASYLPQKRCCGADRDTTASEYTDLGSSSIKLQRASRI